MAGEVREEIDCPGQGEQDGNESTHYSVTIFSSGTYVRQWSSTRMIHPYEAIYVYSYVCQCLVKSLKVDIPVSLFKACNSQFQTPAGRLVTLKLQILTNSYLQKEEESLPVLARSTCPMRSTPLAIRSSSVDFKMLLVSESRFDFC